MYVILFLLDNAMNISLSKCLTTHCLHCFLGCMLPVPVHICCACLVKHHTLLPCMGLHLDIFYNFREGRQKDRKTRNEQ